MEPVGRRKAASRRRPLSVLLVFALGASTAGAALGLLKQPDPRDHVDQFAFATAAAMEVARRAEDEAHAAEVALSAARSRIAALSEVEQQLADSQEAERLGLPRLMRDATTSWGDDRRRVLSAIVRESRRNGLDPALVAALIHVESRFDPFAVSSAGAHGLMQLMPPTARWLLEKDRKPARLRPAHLFNPELNIALGTSYLAQLMDRFEGDLVRALIAYNAGPSVARALQRGSKSWRKLEVYPKNVLAAYKAVLTPPQEVAAR